MGKEISVNIKDILVGSLEDLKRSWVMLLIILTPMVLILAVLPHFPPNIFLSWISFLSIPVVVIILPLATKVMMLVVVYRNRHEQFYVNAKSLLFFVIATVFVVLAVTIGYAMFLIPGVIVSAVSFLYPIFIFKENKGPITSVVASVKLFEGYYVKYILIFVAVSLVILAINVVFEMLQITEFNLAFGVLISSVGLMIYTICEVLLMINLYDAMLKPQQSKGENVESTF